MTSNLQRPECQMDAPLLDDTRAARILGHIPVWVTFGRSREPSARSTNCIRVNRRHREIGYVPRENEERFWSAFRRDRRAGMENSPTRSLDENGVKLTARRSASGDIRLGAH
jgi:hypothetical protein